MGKRHPIGSDLCATAQTRQAVERAAALVDRDKALLSLLDELNPTRDASLWATAGAIAHRLRRFDGTAMQRVRSGYRAPQNAIEGALVDCLTADCPTSQRRIFDLLSELTSDVSSDLLN